MLKIVILIFLLLIVGITVYQTVRIRRLIDKGHVLTDSAQAYQQNPVDPDRHILFLGDSSAVGVGASRPDESLAGLVGAKYPKAEINNLGISGQRVAGLLSSFNKSDKIYDLVVVQIGGNDVLHLTNLVELEKNLNELMTKIKPIAKKTIYISGGDFKYAPVYPWPSNYFFGSRSKKVRDIFARLAQKNDVEYLDLYYADSKNRPKDANAFYAEDMFHLSSLGYKFWFEQLLPLLD